MAPLVGEGEPPGLEEHALGLDALAQHPRVRAFRQLQPDAAAAVLRLGGSSREVALEGLVHHFASLLVDVGDLGDEAIEVAALEEQRHAPLVVHRRVAENVVTKRPRLADELAVRHQVADAQPGQQRLGEAAGIDDVAPAVEALQGSRGRHVEADVGLVVVLDDELAAPLREREQLELAIERHRDGRRKLVARGHEDALAAACGGGEDQPVAVDRQPLHPDALDLRHVDDVRVARVLDAQGLALRQEELDREVEGLLAADGHEHLVRMGDDAALREHALDQLLDQHLVVDGGVVGGPVPDLDDVDRVAHALAPARDGEQRRVGEAAYEGVAEADETVRGLDDALEVEAPVPEERPVVDPLRRRGGLVRRVGPRLVPEVREDVRVDEEPRTVPALDEPVLLERLVGERDRRHAHPELRRQPADGRKRPVQRVLPVDDADRELAPDLLLEALRRLAIDHHHVLVHREPPRGPRGACGTVDAKPARGLPAGLRPAGGGRRAARSGPGVRPPREAHGAAPAGGRPQRCTRASSHRDSAFRGDHMAVRKECIHTDSKFFYTQPGARTPERVGPRRCPAVPPGRSVLPAGRPDTGLRRRHRSVPACAAPGRPARLPWAGRRVRSASRLASRPSDPETKSTSPRGSGTVRCGGDRACPVRDTGSGGRGAEPSPGSGERRASAVSCGDVTPEPRSV